MKNVLKWFTVFFIVAVLVTSLKMAKFSLFRPPEMERLAEYRGGHHDLLPWQNGPDPERHPPFGPPPAGMEWVFVLADLIDLLVYVLILLPLLYGSYLLIKRTQRWPRLNTATPPIIRSFKPDELSSAESDPVSAQQSDYLVLDNHMLDQLL